MAYVTCRDDSFDIFKAIEIANSPDDNTVIVSYVKEHESPGALLDVYGYGILHCCIAYNKFQLMLDLLALKKLPLNQEGSNSETPLFFSLNIHKEEFAIELIKAGADVNIADASGQLPLHLVMGRDSEYARLLLENGATATINCRDNSGMTPLHYAAQSEDLENTCLLLYYGADTDIVCSAGLSPFMHALTSPTNYRLQEILIEYECDFDRQGEEHILYIALDYKSPFVKEIISRGADIINNDVFRWCMECNNLEVFAELWHRKVFEINSHSVNIFLQMDRDLSSIPFLEFIIESEELQYALQFLKTDGVIEHILRLTEKGYSRDLAQRAVYVLLSYGVRLDQSDLEYIYEEYRSEEYENDEFFRILLFMDVRIIEEHSLLPSIIFFTVKDINEIIECYIRKQLQFNYGKEEKVLKELTGYLVHPKLYQYFIEKYYMFLDTTLSTRLTNSFPKLVEISRNKVRHFIHSRVKIKNACHFYTIVEHLPIPNLLIEIIQFRKRIY